MMNKLKLAILTIAAVAGTTAINSATITHAQDNNDRVGRLAQRIADKFDLDEDEVQDVIDNFRSERRKEQEDQFVKHLNEAVARGDITREQKRLILRKQAETNNDQDDAVGAGGTQDANIQRVQAEYIQLINWADQNGIDRKYVQDGVLQGINIQPGPNDKFIFISLHE